VFPRFIIYKIVVYEGDVQRKETNLSKAINEKEQITEWRRSCELGLDSIISLVDKKKQLDCF
jgi:hypothetical protein